MKTKMSNYSWLEKIIDQFKKLPGIGEKSALRITLYLLNSSEKDIEEFAKTIVETKKNLKFCSICGGLTINDPCEICSDPARDHTTLMVVEKPQDIFTIEKTGMFRGIYHVLGGLISPSQGVTPDKLRIKKLMERIGKGNFNEIIIATSPTVEGETTALYIKELLTGMNIKISRLASGVPFGSDLEYIDERTLSQALAHRISLKD